MQVCTYDSDTHQDTNYLSEESFSLIKAKSIHNYNTITPDPTYINTNNKRQMCQVFQYEADTTQPQTGLRNMPGNLFKPTSEWIINFYIIANIVVI